jgi:hypothetical protein
VSEKTCTKCKEAFPATAEFFYKSKFGDGLISQCKVCKRRMKNARYQKNPNPKKKYSKEYAKAIHKKWKAQLPTGIYKITNIENQKAYIGQSSTLPRRVKNHKWNLKRGKHKVKQLQEDYNRLGEQGFEIIEKLPCDTPEDILKEKEQEEIKKHLREGNDTYNRFN